LESYINFNTEKRKIASSPFEKDLYKLLSNSVFGKCMENMRNQIDVKLEYGGGGGETKPFFVL
jgi:hypothetical protein